MASKKSDVKTAKVPVKKAVPAKRAAPAKKAAPSGKVVPTRKRPSVKKAAPAKESALASKPSTVESALKVVQAALRAAAAAERAAVAAEKAAAAASAVAASQGAGSGRAVSPVAMRDGGGGAPPPSEWVAGALTRNQDGELCVQVEGACIPVGQWVADPPTGLLRFVVKNLDPQSEALTAALQAQLLPLLAFLQGSNDFLVSIAKAETCPPGTNCSGLNPDLLDE